MLQADADYARTTPSEAGLRLVGAKIEKKKIVFSTPAIPPGAIRLDALFAAFAAWGSPFGSQISAYLIARIAHALALMHRAGRVPPLADRAGIAVYREGRVEILAFGCPALDVHLRADGSPSAPREELDPRDDVRALASLYCELLSGQTHGAKPLPDPRPRLIELLRRALSPDRAQRFESLESFADAVEREAEPLGIREAPAALRRLIDEWVGTETPRGADAVLARYLERLEKNEVIGAPIWAISIPKNELSEAPKNSAYDEWAAVLGEALPVPKDSAPPLEKPSKLTLPQPSGASLQPGQLPPVAEMLFNAALSRKTVPASAQLKSPISKSMAVQLAIGAIAMVMALAFYFSVPSIEDASRAVDRVGTAIEPATPTPPPELEVKQEASQRPSWGEQPVEAPAKGMVTIMSRPLGATVEIDGSYFGKTPIVRSEQLTKRTYEVTVLLDGYKTWAQKVIIDPASASINVMAVLEAAK